MIEYYSRVSSVPMDLTIINTMEKIFDLYVIQELKEVSEFTETIKEIDSAKMINDDTIKTPFGLTGLKSLSTGCKIVLSYFWLRDLVKKGKFERTFGKNPSTIVLNITECGGNAICYMFKKINYCEDNFKFLLEHGYGISEFVYHDMVIDGNVCKGRRKDNDLQL